MLRPFRKIKSFFLESDAWWTLIINLRASENIHEGVRPIFKLLECEHKLDALKRKSVARDVEKFYKNLEKARY